MKMTAERVFEIIGSIICVPRSHREELMRVLSEIPYEDDGIEHDWQLAECELQIVREVALGLPNREIAAKLKMGETDVMRHLCSIFDKTGTCNRLELVMRAKDKNWVP